MRINLKSKRILLKNFTLKDLNNTYVKWFDGKNEILKYSRHYQKKYNRSILIKNFMNTQLNSFFLGIYEKKSNNLIGTIIAIEEMKGLKLNIGILIGNKYYFSKGYAYESLNLFINFIFKRKNYQSIVFGTNKKNLSMIKLAKKFKVIKKASKFNSSVVYEIRMTS